MKSILIYSRDNAPMLKIISEQLDQLGYITQQTHFLNLPRLISSPFQILHLVIDHLPLTLKEMLFITAAKSLGKGIVLSLLDANKNKNKNEFLKKRLMNWVRPDALTVSQTNYLKIYKDEASVKMIIPSLKEFPSRPASKSKNSINGFLFPIFENLEESLDFKSDKTVFFDGRKLIKRNNSSQLRKKWAQFLADKRIPAHYHLVLSDDRIHDLLITHVLGLVLASPNLLHSEFTVWLELSIRYGHLIVLNQFQATGFSSHWTSGQNCQVISSHHWLQELNQLLENPVFNQPFAITDINMALIDPLFNDLSRLYTKIIYQNTSLLDSDSAKI